MERLDRLLDRLERGGVIPLLGAGISRTAAAPAGFEPSLNGMKRSLKTALEDYFAKSPADENNDIRSFLQDSGSKSSDDSFSLDSEIDFDRLAEAYSWLFSHVELCTTLEIHKFSGLEPTNAHRYLALLVREGVISEVLTTNYDCCVEKALDYTFPYHLRENRHGGKHYHVIRSLEEYRSSGGKRWSDDCDQRRPLLRLYKLNGCAEKFGAEPNDPTIAETILLTEKQLQSHNDSPWKQDLIRDRCRSNNLLLSGFGSEEPQVQHLLVQLLDEFATQNNTSISTAEETLSLPNAPFVAAYSDEPTFRHQQIMEAYLSAHSNGGKISSTDRTHTNIFKGSDCTVLAEPTNKNIQQTRSDRDQDQNHDKDKDKDHKLSADLFWERVFQGTFKRLLWQFLRPNKPFDAWLQTITDHPCAWRNYLKACLYPDRTGVCNNDNPDAPDYSHLDHYFGRHRRLLSFQTGTTPRPLPLMQILKIMQLRGWQDDDDENNWYLPLSEAPITLPALLLFLCLTNSTNINALSPLLCKENHRDEQRNGLKLAVRLRGAPGQQCRDLEVYLCHRDAHNAPPRLASAPRTRLIYRIILPGIDSQPVERRWQYGGTKQTTATPPTPIRFGRELNVSFEELIAALRHPPDICDTEDTGGCNQPHYDAAFTDALLRVPGRSQHRATQRQRKLRRLNWREIQEPWIHDSYT